MYDFNERFGELVSEFLLEELGETHKESKPIDKYCTAVHIYTEAGDVDIIQGLHILYNNVLCFYKEQPKACLVEVNGNLIEPAGMDFKNSMLILMMDDQVSKNFIKILDNLKRDSRDFMRPLLKMAKLQLEIEQLKLEVAKLEYRPFGIEYIKCLVDRFGEKETERIARKQIDEIFGKKVTTSFSYLLAYD